MKILIVSDTHRSDYNLMRVMELERPVDRVIHLGDIEENEGAIQKIVDCPLDIVCGNNDFWCNLPKEKEITLGKYQVFLTHGHTYFVSLDTQMLKREARARGMQIAMYGHTHRPKIETDQGVTILNPGSLSYPRQQGRQPSYIVMEFDTDGEAQFTLKYLD
ncbi:MAG: metallophosphoesterase family protein [Marvinbryantia sp.]|jgi:putative phosphoesterase